MKDLTITKVASKRAMGDFVRLPEKLYKNCPCNVPDLKTDIQTFSVADAQRKPVGGIMGIVNHRANGKRKNKNVRSGLFDCVDDLEALNASLNALIRWGKKRGVTAVQGHMEALGYEKEVDWVQVCTRIPQQTPDKYAWVARLSKEMFRLKVRTVTDKYIARYGYGHKIFHLLDLPCSPFFGLAELTDWQMDNFVKQYWGWVDKRLVMGVKTARLRLHQTRRCYRKSLLG